MAYRPTKHDLAYRNATEGDDIDPFDEAMYLRKISHEYLSVLAHDNVGPASTSFKAMIDAELGRRGSLIARRANWIALSAVAISIVALFT